MNTVPVDFTNGTTHCSHSHPPGEISPEDYHTFQTASISKGVTDRNSDRNISDYTWYDTYARQTIPIVVAAQFSGGVSETQVFCLRPDEIAEGSRTPMKSSAGGALWRTMRTPAASIMLVLVVLVLT